MHFGRAILSHGTQDQKADGVPLQVEQVSLGGLVINVVGHKQRDAVLAGGGQGSLSLNFIFQSHFAKFRILNSLHIAKVAFGES